MSTVEQPNPAAPPYTPPACAWDIRELIRAPLAIIRESTVDCSTCPVFLLCESGTGGVGYVCHACGSTAVWVDASEDHYLAIDCRRHKFHVAGDGGRLPRCHLCSGQALRFSFMAEGQPAMHYVLTAHSAIGAERRLAEFRAAHKEWEAYFAEEARQQEAEETQPRRR